MTEAEQRIEQSILASLRQFTPEDWTLLKACFPAESARAIDRIQEDLARAEPVGAEAAAPKESNVQGRLDASERARLQLQAIYDVVPVGITVTDEDGNIIDCNPAAEQLLGVTRDEHLQRNYAQGWTILDESGAPMAPEDYASVRALRSGQAVRGQRMQVLTPNGRAWLSVNAVPIRQAGLGVVIAFVDISDLVQVRGQVELLSSHDLLTGLSNRAMFIEQAGQALDERAAGQGRVSILLINLRGFSEINEAHGFAIGDRILEHIARRLRATLKPFLAAARFHGDEFAVLADGDPMLLAAAAHECIGQPFEIDEVEFRLDAYIGVAVFPGDAQDSETLLKNAEIAQGRARRGGEPIRSYDPTMSERLVRRLDLAHRLTHAIEGDALHLVFQPQFRLKDQQLVGAEVLLRWDDETLGPISPAEFISIAEERGMMRAIGEWVLAASCRQLNEWGRQGYRLPGRLAVNVSPSELDAPDFRQRVRSILEHHAIDAGRIELEITENAVASDPQRAMRVIDELASTGLSLSIDDFGVGYSSLAALRYFRVDKLKIDASFVTDMEDEDADLTIVQTIVAMARSLGLKALAEGVETEGQRQALLLMGCDEAQGYLLGRPVRAEEFADAWLSR